MPPNDDARIRVGIIGANPDRGWARSTHVPVLQRLDAYDLVAVATTRLESAKRAGAAFGVEHFFSDPRQLVEDPTIDLVTVAVKVPDHYQLVMMALKAGKHVYCEWPLATSIQEAEEMTAEASAQGVQAVVGLQARGSPILRHARELHADGYIGPLVAARVYCALPGGGRRRSSEGLYVIDKQSGASAVSIHGGHAVDALRFCAGDFEYASGLVANHYEEVDVVETGVRLPKTAPDQLTAHGFLADGAIASVSVHGGVASGHRIELELMGELGTLRIVGTGRLNFQMSPLKLFGSRSSTGGLDEIPPPAGKGAIFAESSAGGRADPYPGVEVPQSALVNLAALYSDLAEVIRSEGRAMPDFAMGLSLHQLLARMTALPQVTAA